MEIFGYADDMQTAVWMQTHRLSCRGLCRATGQRGSKSTRRRRGKYLHAFNYRKKHFCLVKNKPNSLLNSCCFYCKKNIYIYKYI